MNTTAKITELKVDAVAKAIKLRKLDSLAWGADEEGLPSIDITMARPEIRIRLTRVEQDQVNGKTLLVHAFIPSAYQDSPEAHLLKQDMDTWLQRACNKHPQNHFSEELLREKFSGLIEAAKKERRPHAPRASKAPAKECYTIDEVNHALNSQSKLAWKETAGGAHSVDFMIPGIEDKFQITRRIVNSVASHTLSLNNPTDTAYETTKAVSKLIRDFNKRTLTEDRPELGIAKLRSLVHALRKQFQQVNEPEEGRSR